MKNSLKLAPIILLFLIAGCDKETPLNSQLDGTWELRIAKGHSSSDVYIFHGKNFTRTTGSKPSGSGTFEVNSITAKDREAGVVYPYRITFKIDGSRQGTYLKTGDNIIVMSSGRADVNENLWIYDKLK